MPEFEGSLTVEHRIPTRIVGKSESTLGQGARVRLGGLGLTIVLAVAGGCSTAASVFLDLPEEPRQPAQAGQPTAAVSTAVAAQDTIRPPIESTLDPDSALGLLPIDLAGDVDWVAALRQRIIKPRWSVTGTSATSGGGFGYDFLIKGPNELFDALFPHSAHTEWLDCQSCHPAVFPYRDAEITMQAINNGESCGLCHGSVAFPASTCVRCHTKMPAPSTPKQAALTDDVILHQPGADSAGSAPYSRARFPHWVHRVRYSCSACHPALFEMHNGRHAAGNGLWGVPQRPDGLRAAGL